jgi:prolyl-tRNA editing enzyme YbaK/EbsC (Cys-tRNA(Pro) deacylase)
MTKLPQSAQRVQDWLAASNSSATVVELPGSTRTAVEAAVACSCSVGQIAKSLVFKAMPEATPVMVIASGSNQVNVRRVEAALGVKLERAGAEFVREATGYAIGGVPPVAHTQAMVIVIDEDLQAYADIWAAAGTPHSVFRTTFVELCALTDGRVLKVKAADETR